MINIVIFRFADPETKDYYYFANQPTRYISTDSPYNKKLSCLPLTQVYKKKDPT